MSSSDSANVVPVKGFAKFIKIVFYKYFSSVLKFFSMY